MRLDKKFKTPDREINEKIRGKKLLLLCYDGDSARVATSVLRAHGYDAHSIKGGYNQIGQSLSELNEALEQEIEVAKSGEAGATGISMATGRSSHPEMVPRLPAASSA